MTDEPAPRPLNRQDVKQIAIGAGCMLGVLVALALVCEWAKEEQERQKKEQKERTR